MPVPTAVPPSGTASSSAWAARARRIDLLDLPGIAPELLAEADRRRVLEVGPAGLHDRPELLLLGDERRLEALERGQQRLLDRHRGRQLERGRDRVVRALAAVDVVVRVDPPARRRAAPAARWATTSFMLVFVEVPEPVW